MGFFDIFMKNSKKVSFDANASLSPEGVGVNEPDHSELSPPLYFTPNAQWHFTNMRKHKDTHIVE